MRLYLFCLALILLSGCAQNPVTGQSDFVMMSESQEMALGRQEDEKIRKQYKVYDSLALQDYVNRVGQKIARQSHRPNLQYHFTVLDSTEINAFALPGGYVYITRGILAYLNSEAELAAVLGHEIGHVTARHGVRQQSASQATNIGINIASLLIPGVGSTVAQKVSGMVSGALLSGYGREHELEADRLGAVYLSRTDYDPQAIIKVIGVLKNQELKDAELAKQEGREPRHYHGLFETHPDNDTRLQQAVSAAGNNTQPHFAGHDEYLAALDGLVFNDNGDQGIVRNNQFYHGKLAIAVQFPETWQLHNSQNTLLAISPQGEAQLQLKAEPRPRESLNEYAQRLAANVPIHTIISNGLPVALIDTPESLSGIIFLDKNTFILQGRYKNRDALIKYRTAMMDTLHSFHMLSNEEHRQIKPLTLRIFTARKNDSYAWLAQNSPLGKSAETYLRLINGQYPKGEPAAGERIKLVE